MIRRPEPL
ncbi:hypothetical protein Zm00014a_031690 [Zea mays]|uniref:Uncharacterized protein n=1 Tax=Zea mays TaxID=4577 RepID=A0A3L6DUM6_MAIZE|nr:hypothetical protein Zm00014a_031690 [Zea mays]